MFKNMLLFISILGIATFAEEVTFSGENWLQTIVGIKENPEMPSNYFEIDEYQNQGWRYLRDVFTYKVGIRNFTFDGKFYVDQPTMGFHPKEKYYYRELIKRRTLSWQGEHLGIKVGNFETSIGRGLSLSLQDDHTVELSNILDGVLFTHEGSLLTATAFAGRSQEKTEITAIDPGSSISTDIDNYNYRDGLYGLSALAFPFQKSDLLSATSIGMGLVLLRDGVEDFKVYDIDTTEKSELLPVQKRTLIWLPSLSINTTLGPVELYSEYVRLLPQKVYYDDSLLSEESGMAKHGYASYTSLGLTLGDFLFNGEYLNYFYSKESSYYGALLSEYTDAPTGRHKQKWHLLTKHTVIPPVGDHLAYNASLTWFGIEGHEFFVLGSYGGLHKEEGGEKSLFGLDKKFHEIYTEWNSTIREKIDAKVAFDLGIIDKDHPDVNSYTLGINLQGKNLFDTWGLGLATEGQFNSEELKIADNVEHLRTLTKEQLPDEDPADIDALEHDDFVELLRKGSITKEKGDWSTIDKSWVNMAFIGTLYLRDKFTISGLIERETLYRNDHTLALEKDIQNRTEWYKSLSFGANFNRNHSLEFAIGDFSRSKICNMGTCTKVPSYRGMKLTFKSTF